MLIVQGVPPLCGV